MKTMFKWDQPSRVDERIEADAKAAAAWLKVCEAVDARDKRTCRACGKRSDPDATGLLKRGHRHHIVYRSAGGVDSFSNLVTLCAVCHNDIHQHRLEVEGNADDRLTFKRRDDKGGWFISKQELAPGVVERD